MDKSNFSIIYDENKLTKLYEIYSGQEADLRNMSVLFNWDDYGDTYTHDDDGGHTDWDDSF